MNIKEIKSVVNAGYDDPLCRQLIIRILSEDEELLPLLMDILAAERKRKAKLAIEINFQLSRAHLAVENPEINEDNFIDREITKFYIKNKEQVGHCFKDLREAKLTEKEQDEEKISWT